jgi:heme/copper-type cytochrome/quinol oxidase subunit 2
MAKRQLYIAIFIILLIGIFSPTLADAQCAMCNATASTANEGNKEGALSLNSGILFLMAIPYLLLTTLVIVWWRFRKQKKAEQQAS